MAKLPLLLLPGLLCDDLLWAQQVTDVHDIAEPVVADLTQDSSIEDMAKRAVSLISGEFALAGLSMGGYVALEIMRLAPQRVTKLALFDTSASPDSPERVRDRMAGISSLQLGRFAGVTNRLMPKLIHPSLVNGPVGLELKSMAGRVGKDAFLRQQLAILGRRDFRPQLVGVQVPTLVAVGECDVLTPVEEALVIHRGIADSRLHVFKACGHLPALEVPHETSSVMLDWLRE